MSEKRTDERTEEHFDEHAEESFEDQVEELFDFDEIIEEALQEGDQDFGGGEPDIEVDGEPGVQNAELVARLSEAEDRAVRASAELENFRRRMRREVEDQLKFANQGLITEMLPVIDNVYRAISAASNEEATAGLLEGFLMVAQQLVSTLKRFHCQPIEAVGKIFDPNMHEAISQMPSNEVEKGHVIQAIQEGYMLHDRVIRPSQVLISSGPAEQAPG